MSSSYRHFDRRIREWALQHFQPGAEILDVGPGRGKFSCLLPEYRAGMDCVEVFEPFVAKYNLPSLYRNVIVKNVLDFEFVPGAYDLVLLGDVIEHSTPDEAGGLLDRIRRAGAAAIVAVPYLLPQGIIEENPFEAHKQGDLTHERMTTLYPKLMPLCTDNKYGVYTSRMKILNNSLNNVQAPIEHHGTTPKASRGGSNPTILVLQNPGRVSAYYIRGLSRSPRRRWGAGSRAGRLPRSCPAARRGASTLRGRGGFGERHPRGSGGRDARDRVPEPELPTGRDLIGARQQRDRLARRSRCGRRRGGQGLDLDVRPRDVVPDRV